MTYIEQVLNAPDLCDDFKILLIKKYIEEVKVHEQKRAYRNVRFDRYA
jgi:hypothetical protein